MKMRVAMTEHAVKLIEATAQGVGRVIGGFAGQSIFADHASVISSRLSSRSEV